MTTDTTAARDQRAREVLATIRGPSATAEHIRAGHTQRVVKIGTAIAAMLAFADEAASQPVGRGDQALREALAPFAAVADEYDDSEDDAFEVWIDAGPQKNIRASFHLGLYRAARTALAALPSSPAIQPVEGLTSGESAFPAQIGRLHLGERRSDGERLCSHSHAVPAGHPLYWPQQISQYDDSDPLCLEHAIEQAADDNGWCEKCTGSEFAATPAIHQDEPWPGFAADQDRRRVLTLARVGLMLSVMAGGDAPEVDGFDASDLYADVLMALAIEDADNPDIALAVVAEDPSAQLLIRQDEPEGAGMPIPDGWAVVPVEPTRGMVLAGAGWNIMNDAMKRAWSAMLAASPRPAATDQAGEVAEKELRTLLNGLVWSNENAGGMTLDGCEVALLVAYFRKAGEVDRG